MLLVDALIMTISGSRFSVHLSLRLRSIAEAIAHVFFAEAALGCIHLALMGYRGFVPFRVMRWHACGLPQALRYRKI